jgi:hypothetical protein
MNSDRCRCGVPGDNYPERSVNVDYPERLESRRRVEGAKVNLWRNSPPVSASSEATGVCVDRPNLCHEEQANPKPQ